MTGWSDGVFVDSCWSIHLEKCEKSLHVLSVRLTYQCNEIEAFVLNMIFRRQYIETDPYSIK